MFVYENGKALILANSRCGHTSMYKYFGMEEYSLEGKITIFDWIHSDSFSQRVVVLRNPYDRVRSALQNLKHCSEDNQLPLDDITWFYNHSWPFMGMIKHCDFKYIDFYKLQEYINFSEKTIRSKESTSQGTKIYVPNHYYSEEKLDMEFDFYNKFLSEREELSVEEWKELTQ